MGGGRPGGSIYAQAHLPGFAIGVVTIQSPPMVGQIALEVHHWQAVALMMTRQCPIVSWVRAGVELTILGLFLQVMEQAKEHVGVLRIHVIAMGLVEVNFLVLHEKLLA